jgi:hypothetical protein
MRRSLILAAFLALIAPFADAQRHGTMAVRSMVPRSATRAAPIVSRVAAAGAVHMSSPARAGSRVVTTRTRAGGATVRVTRPANIARHRPADNNNSNEDLGFSQDLPAPGLGFDETHVVATRGRRSGEHGRNRFDSGFFPFFDGGFILPTPVAVEQAPANEVQEETAVPDPQEGAQKVRSPESAPASSAEAAPAPRRETEEYVFVRRDGTVFFAVAYSWDNGLLRYITQDGLRRSISGDVLDLGATQQFNDQLGLSFHAPA